MIEPLLHIDPVSPQYLFLSSYNRHREPPPLKMMSDNSNSLSTVEAELPPGFRFHPRDDELICDYLLNWISGTGCSPQQFPLLIEVDLNKCEPWDIPETACVGGKEWYFYSQRDRKYATGLRTNRATVSGYWKATGKDRTVTRKGALVGMRKTLVFYQGRAPKGRKSDWVMHEFRLEGNLGPGPKSGSSLKEDWVLCRVFYKSRSEVPNKLLQDNHHRKVISCSSHQVITTPASPPSVVMSLPPLMEPYNNINTIYDHQTYHQAIAANRDHHLYHNHDHEQVPCFSIFSTASQTSPNFSLVTPNNIMDPLLLPNRTMPSCSVGMLPAAQHEDHHQLGITYNTSSLSHDRLTSSLLSNNNNNVNLSSCDKKVIGGVLNHLTKMETSGTGSFGEGSPDSYLSEVGMSSIWNIHHYQ